MATKQRNAKRPGKAAAAAETARQLEAEAIRGKIEKHLALLDEGRAAYRAAGEILDELVDLLRPAPGAEPQAIALPGGQTARLVDRFARANKVFTTSACPRYELDVTRAAG